MGAQDARAARPAAPRAPVRAGLGGVPEPPLALRTAGLLRAAARRLDGEAVELHDGPAGGGPVRAARPEPVRPLAVQPQHARRAPVTDDGRHARAEGLGELHHAVPAAEAVAARADGQGEPARPSWLREPHRHRPEPAAGINRERDRDLEGPLRVDAPGAGAVLLAGPLARPVPSVATAVPRTDAAAVVEHMQGGVPRVHVRFLQVDLGTAEPANGVGVAIVVVATRFRGTLPQRGEVERRVAATARAGEVHGVSQRPTQKWHRRVEVWVVTTVDA
mmetsp:Transcript_122050/g.379938  ORF Transcript_122050/g.379938 Transcript_122050/m.379938 type:complete len:276 (-) Transcript_122050:271-1098(-)